MPVVLKHRTSLSLLEGHLLWRLWPDTAGLERLKLCLSSMLAGIDTPVVVTSLMRETMWVLYQISVNNGSLSCRCSSSPEDTVLLIDKTPPKFWRTWPGPGDWLHHCPLLELDWELLQWTITSSYLVRTFLIDIKIEHLIVFYNVYNDNIIYRRSRCWQK